MSQKIITDFSLGVAAQKAFGSGDDGAGGTIENSTTNDFHWLRVANQKWAPKTEVEELALLTGEVGAAPEPIAGRRHGVLTFEFPLEGFTHADGVPASYDPATDVPGTTADIVPPWFCLLCNAIGANTESLAPATNAAATVALFKALEGDFARALTYVSAGITSATTSALTADAGKWATGAGKANAVSGDMIATRLSTAPGIVQLGFGKSIAGDVVTLFEASKQAVNEALADILPTLTTWMSGDQPFPLTFRLVGNETTWAKVLPSAVCSAIKLKLEAGKVPTIEFTYEVANFWDDPTLGGLHVPRRFLRASSLVSEWNAYLTIAGVGRCGVSGLEIEWKPTIKEIACFGSGSQGVSQLLVYAPRVTATMSVMHDANIDLFYDGAGGAQAGSGSWQRIFQSLLERSGRVSLGCYGGSVVGKYFGILLPSCIVKSSEFEVVDGGAADKVVLQASDDADFTTFANGESANSNGTFANAPGNSPLIVGVG